MAFKPYQFFLKKSDTEYYTVNNNGAVVTVSDPIAQEDAPMDWTDFKVSFARNMKYWGIFREYSIPGRFVKDSAKILRYVYYTEGIEGNCILEVRLLNESLIGNTFGANPYELLFSGNLDFSNCSDERDFFEINVLDRGLAEAIKSNEDTIYEIPLNDPQALTVKLDGVKLRSNALWVPGQGDSFSGDLQDNELVGAEDTENLTIYFSGQEQAVTSFISARDQQYSIHASPDYNISEWLFRAETDLDEVNFSGIIQAITRYDTSSTYFYHIDVRVRRGNTTILKEDMFTLGITSGNSFFSFSANINHNLSIPLQTNDLVYITSRLAGSPALAEKHTKYPSNQSTLTVTYRAKVQPTTTKAFRWYTLASKLGQSIGGYTVYSDFLNDSNTTPANRFKNIDNSPYYTCVFSGDSARNVPNAKIKTSLSDHFQDGFSQWALGLGIQQDIMRLEPISFFFQDIEIEEVFSINNFKAIPAKDYMFKLLNIGYEEQDIENVAGKNDFNTKAQYSVDKFKRELPERDAITKYIASVYAIEQGRATVLNQDDQDNKFDNSTFLIEVAPIPVSGQYVPFRPVGLVLGVDDPAQVYNTNLTPAKKAIRQLPLTRSICNSGVLKFQTSDKNQELQTQYFSGLIVESADIPLDQDTYLGHDVRPWFGDNIYEIECGDLGLYNKIILNPFGYITFTFQEIRLRGYVLEVSIAPSETASCTLRLLAHKDDDLTILIR